MMFRIATQEYRYMLRSAQSAVIFTAFLGLAYILTANGSEFQSTARGGNVYANSPYIITLALIVMSVFATFLAPSFMGDSVLRDVDHKFDGILFTTPISKRDYLLGRFSGAFAAMITVLAGAPLGMFLGSVLPISVPESLGPIHFSYYLMVYIGFIVPSLLVISSIIFSVAVITRRMFYTYLAALAMLIFYLLGGESELLTQLTDPFMYKTFEEQTKYWTASERNNNLISYEGLVLINRLIWISVALFFYGLSYKKFSFRTAKKVKASPEKSATEKAGIKTGVRGIALWGPKTAFHQFLFRTKFEVSSVLKSLPFLIVMGLNLFLMLLALLDREVMYEVNAHPITRLMIGGITEAIVWALLAVLIFYSADIIWREKTSKFSEIIDALPAPNWVFVTSKLAALGVILVSMISLGILLAVSIQVLNGYYHFEMAIYFRKGFYHFLSQFTCLAVLACFCQVLGRGRLAGMLLMGLFFVISVGSIDILGFEHPLLRYGLGGIGAMYSDMNGFGRFTIGGDWLRAYWASISGILLIFTYLFWNRGTPQPMMYRIKALKSLKQKNYAIPAIFFMMLFLATGSHIYYNVNVLNGFVTDDEKTQLRVNYEKRYRPYEQLPMPRTVDIKTQVALYPYKGRIETQTKQILENKTEHEIRQIHLVFPSNTEVPKLELEGAVQKSFDANYNYYIFSLEKAMAPGERRLLDYETIRQQRGYTHKSDDRTLVRNGTFIHNNQITPHVGFQPNYMVRDRNTRRDHGLEPLARMPALEDTSQYTTNDARKDSDFINFEATVSTVSNQIAVAPGYLEKDWVEGDRRYFTYKMDKPIINHYAFLSAEYEVLREQSNGINIEIFYHKPHTYNLKRMMAGVKESLAYYSKEFGDYPYRQMRILEFPAYRNFAQSFPNTIPYSESIGFVAKVEENDLDMPYYVTAHEVAHQWWGTQIVPANNQGAKMLNETLAQYSALLVMEQKYGKNRIRKFLKSELDSYLAGRARDAEGELPLYRVEKKQEYIHYRKGSLIMYALRDYLGVDVVNRSLRKLMALRANRCDPYPISSDLLNILKAEAGPAYVSLIEDFFEKITIYDLAVDSNEVTALTDGRFRVKLELSVAKYYADALGNETEAQFDIPVDIGLFQRRPSAADFSDDHVIHLEKHRMTGPKATLELIVNEKPAFVGIDPYHKLIERDPENNLVAAEERSPKLMTSNSTETNH